MKEKPIPTCARLVIIVAGLIWLCGPSCAGAIVVENPWLRLTLDEKTGAVIGIANRKTGTECRTSRRDARPPVIVDAYSANQAIYIRDPFEQQSGGFSTYTAAKAAGVKSDLSHLREPVAGSVQLTQEKKAGATIVTCQYDLPGGIHVSYSISASDDSPTTTWHARVENRGGETPAKDQRVYRVAFPVLEGVRIGPKHESNFLARPFAQGELIPDPASYEFTRPKGSTPTNVLTYIGWASMPWQDLYAPDGGGLYLASHDLTFQQLDVEAWPDKAAGTMTLGMRTLAFMPPGKSWESQPFEVAVHDGDWHWAADRYRQWAKANHHPYDGPSWVRNDCDGWLGTGVPTRSYGDYLAMFEDAKWLGLNYLQIWSEMLEKVGPNKSRKAYYCFLWPDPTRGGEEELARVVKQVRSAGGHIGFYHNLWTWDSQLAEGMQQWKEKLPADVHVPAWWGEARTWSSVFPDGSRQAGNFRNGYAGMCPSSKGYQDYILSWVVDRYVKRYGADAWYFDSMPVTMFGASRICFSDEHPPCPQPHGVGQGMIQLLQRVREAARSSGDLAITSETVSDALMQYNSHALGLELIDGLTRYPHPEIYAYTFPEHAIFSGTCNGAGSGLKYYYPDLEKPRRQDTMNRVFLMGYRFDILMGKLNREDPFVQYMKKLITLRQKVKADLYASDFRDEIGLGPLPEKVYAKVFRRRDGRGVTINLVDRRQEQAGFELAIDVRQQDFSTAKEATLYQLDGSQLPLQMNIDNGRAGLRIPALSGEAAAIVVR